MRLIEDSLADQPRSLSGGISSGLNAAKTLDDSKGSRGLYFLNFTKNPISTGPCERVTEAAACEANEHA